jgi:hypothetical protein
VRGLATHQPTNEQSRIGTFAEKLRVVEAAELDAKYAR